eukprot:CAMPEP_0171861104 /NCGR_PEP_ID=MMETSP0992-20121227/26882_1 /TAXON_ID=483369 /ORGANISM="non described non described, Strain CCMP2098" /LENGTH=604 /DNA_ID=CAMNT_0012483059 /DNA_START=8 /DNA_END=1820 /DNA_ORIENTATION=+
MPKMHSRKVLALALCGLSAGFQARIVPRLPTALNLGLLNRGDKEKTDIQKMDKRGFPIGDPRAFGGTEDDLGLQVGPRMWRFPTSWPYPDDFYSINSTVSAAEYWAGDSTAKPAGPFIVGEDLEAMHAHLERHLPADARILDLGAGKVSPLPPTLAVKEVVGVSASEAEMAGNGQLSERVVVDLNALDLKLPFEDASFDAVVCVNTMEYLTDARAVFREVYRVLKPGGVCEVLFLSQGSYEGGEEATAKYWGEFTDAQKMYVAGTFFQFTSGGWSQLKGYDLSTISKPQEAEEEKNPLVAFFKGDKEDEKNADDKGLFAVSSVKAAKPPADASPMRRMQAGLWEEYSLLPDERRLCCERLYAQYQSLKAAGDEAGSEACVNGAEELGTLYDILEPMSKALPVPIRALLASNIAPALASPDSDREAVLAALKEGLGLTPPQDAFWKPLGEMTSELIAEDKIWLLVDFVPLFGKKEEGGGSSTRKQRLAEFPVALKAALECLDARFGEEDPVELGDKQLLAVELALTDFLLSPDDGESVESFTAWLSGGVTPDQLKTMLKERKAFTTSAKEKEKKKHADKELKLPVSRLTAKAKGARRQEAPETPV